MKLMLTALLIVGFATPTMAMEPKPAVKTEAMQAAKALARCEYRPQQAVLRRQPNRPMRLTEAPPARMERAVNRTINGCPVPVIVRYDVEQRDR